MASPFYTISPNQSVQHQNEVRMRLYLLQVHLGPKHNQETIVTPTTPQGIGMIGVNDWTVIDKPLYSNATTVGNAKGMHFDTGSGWWYMTFSLRFGDARFNGSTLQVMGVFLPEGECSIVGGTGEFSMARGTINYKTVKETSEGVIRELDIRAFYAPKSAPEPADA